jgi:hypothetical protein
MDYNSKDYNRKNKYTQDVKIIISVGPDHRGVVHDDPLKKSFYATDFFHLIFIKSSHQFGIGRMTLVTIPDGFLTREDLVGNKGTVVNFFGMTFNTTNRIKMKLLVREPVMFCDQVRILFICKYLVIG